MTPSRLITVSLGLRGVSCTARSLDEQAPRTCAAVRAALPVSAPVFHGKYARNEIYTLLPAFAGADPGKENTTVTPIRGDLCCGLPGPVDGWRSWRELELVARLNEAARLLPGSC